MNRRVLLATTLLAAAWLAGCASGPKFSEVSGSIGPIPAGDGRIFFFRSSSMMGAAIQPDIRLNGEVVGTSKPGGFFFVDRPAGGYTAATSTEVEKATTFSLAPGETKYLRTSPSFGLLVGHIAVDVEDPRKAQAEIETLSMTGGAPATPGRSAAPDAAAPAAKPAPVAEPPLDASGRPAHLRPLDAAALEGRTWIFPHPRDPARLQDVRIRFAGGVASASNARSASTGPYTVKDDMVCIDFQSRDWGHTCYYVYEAAPAAGGSPAPMLWTVYTHRAVPLTIE
ncbi:MAG TPA: DUF2846 domain-containing protein [Burkholderiaceae bacterium]